MPSLKALPPTPSPEEPRTIPNHRARTSILQNRCKRLCRDGPREWSKNVKQEYLVNPLRHDKLEYSGFDKGRKCRNRGWLKPYPG